MSVPPDVIKIRLKTLMAHRTWGATEELQCSDPPPKICADQFKLRRLDCFSWEALRRESRMAFPLQGWELFVEYRVQTAQRVGL